MGIKFKQFTVKFLYLIRFKITIDTCVYHRLKLLLRDYKGCVIASIENNELFHGDSSNLFRNLIVNTFSTICSKRAIEFSIERQKPLETGRRGNAGGLIDCLLCASLQVV